MPKFAANLSMMFQEIGFLDRFDAAARRRLQGGRVPVPLRPPARGDRRAAGAQSAVAGAVQHGARRLGRRRARPRGAARARAGIPRRRRQGDRLCQGDEMPAVAHDGRVVAGRARQGGGRARLYRQSALGRRPGRRAPGSPRSSSRSTPATSPAISSTTRRRRCAIIERGRPAQPEAAARPLSRADHGGRSRRPGSARSPAITRMSRSPAIPAATSRMSARSTTRSCSTCSTSSAMPAGSAANTGRRARRWPGSAGPSTTASAEPKRSAGIQPACRQEAGAPKGGRAAGMRIVITGGCGFLGRRVAIRLLRTRAPDWGRSTSWCCSTTPPRPCRCPRTGGSGSSPATSPTATRSRRLIAARHRRGLPPRRDRQRRGRGRHRSRLPGQSRRHPRGARRLPRARHQRRAWSSPARSRSMAARCRRRSATTPR